MNVLDLFSGIGGFSLGLERAGMKTVAFCEIEQFPRKVLKKNFPGVPIYEDIRKLTAERLAADGIGPIDVICGGFPCQPFSVAGKRKGQADDRDLWPEMFRVVKDVRPSWVVAENVTGLASLGKPVGPCEVESETLQRLEDHDYLHKVLTQEELLYLGIVVTDLERAGYRLPETLDGTPIIPVIPAGAVGAWHRRARVWIIAYASSTGPFPAAFAGLHREEESRGTRDEEPERRSSVLPNATSERWKQEGGDFESPSERSGGICEIRSDTGGQRSEARISEPGQRQEGITEKSINHSEGWNVTNSGESRLSKPQCEDIPGARRRKEGGTIAECNWWAVEPDVGRVAHGVSRRVDRLKGLGNAVVPQVVEIIGRAIMQTLQEAAWSTK